QGQGRRGNGIPPGAGGEASACEPRHRRGRRVAGRAVRVAAQELTLKAIADLVVRVADLAEAEGRALRSALRLGAVHVRRRLTVVGMGLCSLALAVVLGLTGIGLIVLGAFRWLERGMGQPGAAAIVGLAALCIAGGFLWTFQKIMNR